MRGYQKRVIYLKNVESSVFEEAYFVIKPEIDKDSDFKKEKPDFIKEANRIIEESVGKKKSKKIDVGFKEISIFVLGFIISSLISLIFI